VKRFWGHPTSQQAAAVVVVVVVVMVLHMTLTLDISFLLLPSISRREPCQIVHNLFLSLGDEWVGGGGFTSGDHPSNWCRASDFPSELWQAAKFVINQSATHMFSL